MLEFLQYDFMVRALIGAALVGMLAPAIGMFLVLRRFALMADTLSHVAFMGVAIGILTRVFPSYTALGAASIGAVVIEQLRSKGKMPSDVAMAVVLYASLAVAVVIISLANGFNVDLFDFLFGSVLTISPTDVWLLVALAVAVVAFVGVFLRELAQSSFDDDLARVSGVPVRAVNLGLAILTGAAITLSMRVVGVLLVGALMVVPVLVGLRLATNIRAVLAVAVAIGVLSAVTGLVIGFYADVAAGGAIVLTAMGTLAVVEVAAALRGRLSRPNLKQGDPRAD
jgi:zinc transport system permease protein